MRRLGGLAGFGILFGAACSTGEPQNVPRAKAHPAQSADYGATEQIFDGPGLVCGEAFALVLDAGEQLTRRDPGLDFLTYRVKGRAGDFLLYEGNAPQPHDDEIQTGLNFPAVIAIHDNRTDAQKRAGLIRSRLIVAERFGSLCPKAKSS